MCAERGSFVVGLFLCTPIAIRAFGHVSKNVAFERFWQNCVRGAQNEASQHRTCCCLARRTASWNIIPALIHDINDTQEMILKIDAIKISLQIVMSLLRLRSVHMNT